MSRVFVDKKALFDLQPCLPPLWARSGHGQTILGHLIPSASLNQIGERIEILLADGDRLVSTFYKGKSNLVVYVFHGLGGDTSADYMERTASVCLQDGHSVILVNHRGSGEGQGLAKAPYHSGSAEDISQVIKLGRQLHPDKKHIAIGFSLSGNALLLLLSRKKGSVLPDAAIAINSPIRLEKSAYLLRQGLNRIYDFRFYRLCRQLVESRRAAGLLHTEYSLPQFGSILKFDALYTASAAGFQSREHYYQMCSTQSLLKDIQTPTVLLTAKDDPFVDYRDYLEAPLSDSIFLHIEPVGGHMGYINGTKTPLGTIRWLDYAIHHFLKRLA